MMHRIFIFGSVYEDTKLVVMDQWCPIAVVLTAINHMCFIPFLLRGVLSSC
jgi:hypothetical protein